MSSVFTEYVRLLASMRAELDQRIWQQLRETLRKALIFEMKKRSVWRTPPKYLGIYGSDRWDSDQIEELTLACYAYTFLDRMRALIKKLGRVDP